MATVVMLVVDEAFAAVICGIALLYRARSTAAIAGLASLVLPLLSIKYGEIVWDATALDIIAAIFVAYQWVTAAKNPLWTGGLPRLAAHARRFF
ncbi:MAG: hypothetical protein ACRDQ5_21890 [Sciscionella sp.]